MEGDEVPEHYFTYGGRLDSFETAQPVRRPANAKGKAPKPITWPHEELDPKLVSYCIALTRYPYT